MNALLDGGWTLQVGDPTAIGWLTVAAYGATAWTAWKAARTTGRKDRDGATQEMWFWVLVMAIVLALGVNKQLDLQSLGTVLAKRMAHEQGWYEDRHRIQRIAILGGAVVGLLGGALSIAWLRHVFGRVWIGLVGLGLLAAFVVSRAASFHHVESLAVNAGPSGANVVFELSAIAVTYFAARRAARSD